MKRPAALFPISLALGAMMLAPGAGARESTQLKKCQTISQPGSYELADNLTAGDFSDCLVITASFVTIDLAGFSISGGLGGIRAAPSLDQLQGIAVRNGSIFGVFEFGVDLEAANGSIVEGLRVSYGPGPVNSGVGITASGIVKGNTVTGGAVGIAATGTVTGNYATGNFLVGISVGQGSTVIGNTALDNLNEGIDVSCPSNVTDNTAVNNHPNLVLNGEGCNNTNNVAP